MELIEAAARLIVHLVCAFNCDEVSMGGTEMNKFYIERKLI